ncbi:7009_t:CDS:2, partial [Gigaspora rosea]
CPANDDARTFAEYLLRIGNGTEPTIENDLIQLPDEMIVCPQNNKNLIDSLINTIYSNLTKNVPFFVVSAVGVVLFIVGVRISPFRLSGNNFDVFVV